jgi:predicted permease
VLAVAVTICAALAAGVGAERRFGTAAQRVVRRALDAMLWVALPFASFFLVARLEITTAVGAGLALAYLELLVVGALAWLVGARALRLPAPAVGALVCVTGLANTGYLGLPATIALLGVEQLGAAVAWDALVSGPMGVVAGFAVGAALGSAPGAGPRARAIAFLARNPPLWATALALVAPDALAPDVLVEAARLVVIALLPVGFFVVGVSLASEAEEGRVRFPPPLTRPVAIAVALRLVVAPALFAALATLVDGVPDAFYLLAAMPSAISALVIAHAYGLDVRLTASAIAWTTALAVAAGLVTVVA